MGKKSRKPSKITATKEKQANYLSNSNNPSVRPPQAGENTAAVHYPSDGPSEEEINSLQTNSSALQCKLNLLTDLGLANNRKEFVNQFVPLDLSEQDKGAYLTDLTSGEEAESQWKNLLAEIITITTGKNVNKIEGDQVNNATFFFQHPIFKECDREVSFTCINGEWRAEG